MPFLASCVPYSLGIHLSSPFATSKFPFDFKHSVHLQPPLGNLCWLTSPSSWVMDRSFAFHIYQLCCKYLELVCLSPRLHTPWGAWFRSAVAWPSTGPGRSKHSIEAGKKKVSAQAVALYLFKSRPIILPRPGPDQLLPPSVTSSDQFCPSLLEGLRLLWG